MRWRGRISHPVLTGGLGCFDAGPQTGNGSPERELDG
jgi:hypothetical protein